MGEDLEGVLDGEARGEQQEEEEEKEKREGEVRDWRWLGLVGRCMIGLGLEGLLLGRWRCCWACWGLLLDLAGCCFCWLLLLLVCGLQATTCFEPFLAPGLCRWWVLPKYRWLSGPFCEGVTIVRQ